MGATAEELAEREERRKDQMAADLVAVQAAGVITLAIINGREELSGDQCMEGLHLLGLFASDEVAWMLPDEIEGGDLTVSIAQVLLKADIAAGYAFDRATELERREMLDRWMLPRVVAERLRHLYIATRTGYVVPPNAPHARGESR